MPNSEFTCRSCTAAATLEVLDLGATPLANALLPSTPAPGTEPRFPLVLVFCPQCSLVQITETVPPEVLFRNYLYFSSFSDTMLAHAASLVKRLVAERALDGSSLVVEAASNDGYLLKNYVNAGVPVLGIEPAINIAKTAEASGVPTIAEFFGDGLATRLAGEGRRADVFHAHNVLAHVADLNGFVKGIAAVLKPDGLAVVEAPYVGDMIDNLEFDTIYHEHLCYFSLTSLTSLFARHGLTIFDVERIAIHGGTLRIFASPARSDLVVTARASALRQHEEARGIPRTEYYRDFASRVATLKTELDRTLRAFKAQGKRVAAYGASAKGSTLLNAFGLGSDVIDYVVDRSTYKQGHVTPGTHLPIFPPEKLLETAPDYVLLLTWNFSEEILAQQAEYRRRGGKFVVPVPQVQVV